ncbi:hypothetical protein GRB07_09685 [Yersinia pestis]|nr:hypothetical protein [Yersinia pestis]TNV57636.1 hypothetical protein FIN96_07705 [Yersinia pestis]
MAAKIISLIRLLTNPDDAILNGEDSVRAKDGAARAYMDVFTASLRSACSLRRGHFVNNLTYLFNFFLYSCSRS